MAASTLQTEIKRGDNIRILSIDGGGVRGLIPLQSLKFLEQQLQKLDGKNARLADYFDIMAGTGTGGLIAIMLATPDPNDRQNHPYSTQKIEDFFLKNASSIFPQPRIWNLFQGIFSPQFNSNQLNDILEQEKFHEIRLRDTVTNLVIPTFDTQTQLPTIFASNEANTDELRNPHLIDVCLSTTAAPTYFSSHQFTTNSSGGETRDFNLIDGGIVANNPALIAINLVTRAVQRDSSISDKKKHLDHFIVVSLGTGLEDGIGRDAENGGAWGSWRWIRNSGRIPLLQSTMNASSDMVDIHTALMFANAKENYLRIQEWHLNGGEASLLGPYFSYLSTDENLRNLVRIGEELLDKPVRSLDIETGRPKMGKEEYTNRMALIRMAERLSEEKRRDHRKLNVHWTMRSDRWERVQRS